MLELVPGERTLLVGFFDLDGYARWCVGRPPADVLAMAQGLQARAGAAIAQGGGCLVKAIGDGGLFVFPAEPADAPVLAMADLKRDLDEWLAGRGYPGPATVKMHTGVVAVGEVGAPGHLRMDVYGETVNAAAMVRCRGLAVTEALHRHLSDPVAARFAPASGAFAWAPGS